MTPPKRTATAERSAEPDGPRRLFLLDGHSLAYRAFFALPPTLATSSGTLTNAVYGFTSMVIKLLAEEKPDLIAVFFDAGKPTVRLAKDADYKAGRRETPQDFTSQLGLIEEVLEAMRIPVLRIADGNEADDAIGTLAIRAHDQGVDATIVTADRDFFQLVRPGVTVMFNRKGISDIVRYDEQAVAERYGIAPAQYLDFVALKGDTSDNIPGVPGVGDKTAAKLVNQFGDVEGLVANTDMLKGKQKENVEATAARLELNKELARIDTDIDLPVTPDDCVMGEWDTDEVRRLFTSLEFRSLFDRLQEIGTVKPKVDIAELDLREVTADELASVWAGGAPVGVRLDTDEDSVRGAAISAGGAQAAYAALEGVEPLTGFLADGDAPKWTHDAKSLERVALRSGSPIEGVTFDTMLAGYLLDPATADYPLSALAETYLGADVLGAVEGEEAEEGQLFADSSWRAVAAEAAAVALLAPVMEERIEKQGLRSLLDDVELPLSSVLARMEAHGIRLDVDYLEEMGESVRDRMATLKADVYTHAGEEFNLNSPPQLRKILYDQLGLQPGKRTPKGELSTDASVLEKLRDAHPIVDALLSWRELDKLNSTYLEALPKLVDPRDGRVHTTFVQTAAATGRLSSTNPNLQNVPIRTELGRQIRRAFVPGSTDQVLLVLDYSQIELRILAHLSGDEGLRAAFESGDDIHTATAARVFGLPPDAVDPLSRSRAKMVNYGLAYGMNAWGLAQRLDIAPDEAQEIMDAYFASFPAIREYLDNQVGHATVEGFTETLLGRRRYIPELQAANPRVRDMGRRQALNAPIQGSASDVFKVAMIRVDEALREHDDLDGHMMLTVHDELVFEVPEANVEAIAELVKERMEHAVDLEVPLRADVGWGTNWSDAAPAGH
ncbi:MAG TPA: DNA polymerase I [Actinomycetota bacterium]|nr:DNA polymerase I [Actinomycetota bacterium]